MVLYKKEITIMIKRDLLEAIEDMPMNAEIWISQQTSETHEEAIKVDYDEELNIIVIC